MSEFEYESNDWIEGFDVERVAAADGVSTGAPAVEAGVVTAADVRSGWDAAVGAGAGCGGGVVGAWEAGVEAEMEQAEEAI